MRSHKLQVGGIKSQCSIIRELVEIKDGKSILDAVTCLPKPWGCYHTM